MRRINKLLVIIISLMAITSLVGFASGLTYHENPMFAEKVKKGELPPVEERLPKEPFVVTTYDEIGTYGGTLRGISISYESGTSEIMSWRQVNMVRFDDDCSTIVPNVAKEWRWNDDFTEILFRLRQGHRWSDGEPFTVDDVVFWMDDIILNEEIHKATPSPWGEVGASVEKIDDITVKFKFDKPFTGLPYYLGGGGSYFVPLGAQAFFRAVPYQI